MKRIILKQGTGSGPFHPWIYKNHIALIDPGVKAGDVVAVSTHDNISIGTGYYNPGSAIAIRILSTGEESIEKKFFIKRLSEALKKRESIKKISNAYRVVSSEADGLPGLILDLYNDTIVLQATTLGMDRFKNEIISAVREVINPVYIYEKSDSISRKLEGLKSIAEWHGEKGKGKIIIYEDNARFAVDIIHGHKTGFYLDQRKARIAAGHFAKDRKILDIFCYTGGFSIHAGLQKAGEVTCIDIKDEWLAYAKGNVSINNVPDIYTWIKGNAFDILRKYIQKKEHYDMIILDPPSFVKNKYGLKRAYKGYLELNRLAMRLLSEKGVLCTFTCSHHMRNEIFSDMLKKAAMSENKTYSILKRCHQDMDHPIIPGIPETEYLKGYFLSVSSAG